MTISTQQRLELPTHHISESVRPRLRRRLLGRLLLSAALVAAAIAVAPQPSAAPALAALTAILCSIFLFPRVLGIPSHVWGPALGAASLLFLRHLPLGVWGAALKPLTWNVVGVELIGHLDVPILILSHAYLAISLDESGVFNWCSLKLMRAGRGSGRRLLVAVFIGVSLLTFFTSNDIIILSITPILIYLGNNARIRNLVPFLMAQFIAANTASMGMYVGNPTNIVIADAVGMGFAEFAQRMFVPTLVATGVTLLLVLLVFSRLNKTDNVQARYELLPVSDAERWTRSMTLKVSIFAACLTLLAVLGNPRLIAKLLGTADPQLLRGTVTRLIVVVNLLFALFAFVLDLIQDRRQRRPQGRLLVRQRFARMPLEIVPFFLSFCLVLRAFEEAGLTQRAVQSVVQAFQHGPLIGSLKSGLYGVLVVNVMNNIPATILFQKAWLGSATTTPPVVGLAKRLRELDPRYPDIFVDTSLFAANIGANLTFIGALAGLMWLRVIRDQVRRAPEVQRLPTARDFLKYGLIIVPVVTVATCAAIALLRTLD